MKKDVASDVKLSETEVYGVTEAELVQLSCVCEFVPPLSVEQIRRGHANILNTGG